MQQQLTRLGRVTFPLFILGHFPEWLFLRQQLTTRLAHGFPCPGNSTAQPVPRAGQSEWGGSRRDPPIISVVWLPHNCQVKLRRVHFRPHFVYTRANRGLASSPAATVLELSSDFEFLEGRDLSAYQRGASNLFTTYYLWLSSPGNLYWHLVEILSFFSSCLGRRFDHAADTKATIFLWVPLGVAPRSRSPAHSRSFHRVNAHTFISFRSRCHVSWKRASPGYLGPIKSND